MIATLLLVTACAAWARIDPDLLLYRGRASRLLEPAERVRLKALAEGDFNTPDELAGAITDTFGRRDDQIVLELYAGVALVERRQSIQAAFVDRIDLLTRAQKLLSDYVEQAESTLRRADYGGQPIELQEPAPFPPKAESNEERLLVLRHLVWPRESMGRTPLDQLRQAARSDLAAVEARLEKARTAQTNYDGATAHWLTYLRKVAEAEPRLQEE
ncbi:MAG: hypothetical protein AB7S38_03165 [Vulcanimicrobiota bacterium]